ncbi:MAG TPA: hypothetical protein VEU96_00065 [Bryobacteraceae bacterium]|nr:hypothetical protein [Bryobacteraceae bacterium]
MSRHLLIVANGFRAVGLLLGIPSLVVCVWLTATKIELARAKTDASAQSSPDINIKRDGIVGVVSAVATVFAMPLWLFSKVADWIADLADILAAVLTLVSAFLFFTGRGLVLHATWARIAAVFETSVFLFISFLVMIALRRGAATFALIPIGGAIYMLWVLVRRFN